MGNLFFSFFRLPACRERKWDKEEKDGGIERREWKRGVIRL